jgi:hypothetical protein
MGRPREPLGGLGRSRVSGFLCMSVPEKNGEVRKEETDGWGPSVSEREGERGGLGWC